MLTGWIIAGSSACYIHVWERMRTNLDSNQQLIKSSIILYIYAYMNGGVLSLLHTCIYRRGWLTNKQYGIYNYIYIYIYTPILYAYLTGHSLLPRENVYNRGRRETHFVD